MFSSTCLTQSSNIAHGKALHIWFNMLFSPSAPKTLIPVANPGEASNYVSHNNFTAFSSFLWQISTGPNITGQRFVVLLKKCCILVT